MPTIAPTTQAPTISTAASAISPASSTQANNQGLSSIPSTLSSSAEESSQGPLSYAFSIISYPFVLIGRFFNYVFESFASLIGLQSPSADETTAKPSFLEQNLNNLSGDVLIEAQDRFSHSNLHKRLSAFSLIQGAPGVSVDVTRSFYDLLGLETQNHLKRHIWIENGRNDNSLGYAYADSVIASDIKAEIIHRALDKFIQEVKI